MNASEYLASCPYREECKEVKCSPWGFTHSQSPEVNGKRLLLVGLNANDSDSALKIDELSREEYSVYLKGLIKKEVEDSAYKCLSNPITPITNFLYHNEAKKSQLDALEHLNWCNVISCFPATPTPGSRPTENMYKFCTERLREDANHELIIRIRQISPTHIVVFGNAARRVWQKSAYPDSMLSNVLDSIMPHPAVCFCKHPSQRRLKRSDYWDEVYGRLTGSR